MQPPGARLRCSAPPTLASAQKQSPRALAASHDALFRRRSSERKWLLELLGGVHQTSCRASRTATCTQPLCSIRILDPTLATAENEAPKNAQRTQQASERLTRAYKSELRASTSLS